MNRVNSTDEVLEQLHSAEVSASYFRLFGASLERGRGFTPDEDRVGGELVVVISHDLWARRFARDPQVLGRTVWLDGSAHSVVGVLAAGFDFEDFGPAPVLWLPLRLDPNS